MKGSKKLIWNVGCSGFYYKHWRPDFYSEDIPIRSWFEYYSTVFKTVELNTTFYNFPKPEMLNGWYKKSPDDFIFTVKVPRLITHYKKFVDCKTVLNDFYKIINAGLKEKLGCVLFQLPSNIKYSKKKLEEIIQSLEKKFMNVLEFRDASWWNDDVLSHLAKNNITFCGISHPELPDQVIHNTAVLYYRFHGVPRLYTSAYSVEGLRKVISEIQKSTGTKKVFLYFNNDSKGWAYRNAQTVLEMTGNVLQAESR